MLVACCLLLVACCLLLVACYLSWVQANIIAVSVTIGVIWCRRHACHCRMGTVDCTLTYKPHLRKAAAKTRTRNNLVHMLAGTTWGAGAKTLRTSALALCYSEYCAPVWRNSAHTNLVDVQLNNTMRTITGSVRCTRTHWLPVLSNIAPADIRRELATSKMILRARGKPELPLPTDIDFHPRPRLKSRRPIWSNLPDEALTIQDLWRIRWQNKIVDVPNKSLIKDPTIQLPGMDLLRGQWSLLNRFRSDAGPCCNSMHEWGYIASPLCDCGEPQTMRHVVNECPLTCFDGGISELHLAQDAAFNWLLRQNLRSWKANDNNNMGTVTPDSEMCYVIRKQTSVETIIYTIRLYTEICWVIYIRMYPF